LGLVQALVDGTVEWGGPSDLGLETASGAPQVDDVELLQPHRLYESQGRMSEYRDGVERIKIEWRVNIGAVPPIGGLSEVLSPSRAGGRSGR